MNQKNNDVIIYTNGESRIANQNTQNTLTQIDNKKNNTNT